MSEITLDALKSDYAALGARIAAYEANRPRVVGLPAIDIELASGEHYVGVVLNEDGTIKHHLVLLGDKPDDTLTWEEAKVWAATVHGGLPDRQEAALIYANCKAHVDTRWHWTNERHETNASYAWFCSFSNGGQYCSNASSAGAARAVRRLKP
jgi:hypothetical protein